MDGRHARLVSTALDRLPTIPRTPAAPTRSSGHRLKSGWAALLGLGWPLVLAAARALEPVPTEPEATPDPIVDLASLALFSALVATAVAAAHRQRAAAVAGVVVGLILMVSSVTCPLTGHHSFGLWWVAQLGLVAIMLAASLAGLGDRARAGA